MKLRMIAESSIYDLSEGRWDQSAADKLSRDQTGKNLVVTSLTKLRNMLEPIGILKGGMTRKHTVPEPTGGPQITTAFNKLREVVKKAASDDAKLIAAGGQEAQNVGSFWGLKVPTSWHDVHAGQYGKPTAEGTYDDIIRMGIKKAKQVSPEQLPEVFAMMGQKIMQRAA